MDSRTMLPTDLAPGMLMRAEFRVMENGQYYVNRITPIRDNSEARETVARDTRGNEMGLTRSNQVRAIPRSSVSDPSASEPQPMNAEPSMASEPTATNDRAEMLPQTAGHQPLIALVALLMLVGAGGAMLIRRRSGVDRDLGTPDLQYAEAHKPAPRDGDDDPRTTHIA
jgi:LPXTG-motif cell wall-anchored protein